ncbi:MAG: DUF1559 domain-containing protein [Planctomycetota bacterium]|nr:DUF1559 domain-containing protein [Planctomycetota bacterium]
MQCPACAEQIPADTEICPYCKTDVQDYSPARSGRNKGGGSTGAKAAGVSILMVLGIVAACVLVCGGILAALMIPAVSQAREAARRAQCMNNLRQIGLAIHAYSDAYNSLPPAITYSADGKPLHSWRVLILPYLGESGLYNMYNMDEPWDSPNNLPLQGLMPRVYACPSSTGTPGGGTTQYLAISGNGTIFPKDKPVSISHVTDGISNTLMVGESESASVPWMKPVDIDASNGLTMGPAGLNSSHTNGAIVLLADGSVRFLPNDINPQSLNALSTISGGEAVPEF